MTKPTMGAAVPVLPVRDIAEAVRFYRERLGFACRHAEDDYAVLGRDDVEVHLWRAADEGWRARGGKPVQSGAESFLAGTASCRISVAGIDALHDEMQRHGVVHPNGPLADKSYGLREFAVLDGDGNLITFFGPGAAQPV